MKHTIPTSCPHYQLAKQEAHADFRKEEYLVHKVPFTRFSSTTSIQKSHRNQIYLKLLLPKQNKSKEFFSVRKIIKGKQKQTYINYSLIDSLKE